MIISTINDFIKKNSKEFIGIRNHIHSNPELSFHEIETSNFIEKKLNEFGFTDILRITKTSVVANLIINKNFKTIALRADIDALPIKENNNVDYVSVNHGVMHACGHDVHTTCLLGVAKFFIENKALLTGNIKFIFQHAEEKLPGGAKELIKKGVLDNPDVDLIIAQHVDPAIEVGKIGIKKGIYMASTDEIYITINGKGGHAAMPHDFNDTILAASTLVVNLQQIVSRLNNPAVPTVLSFGKFIANGATNVIPEEVKIEGTFRTMNEKWREKAHKEIEKICKSIADAMNVKCKLEIKKGYPSLINSESETENAIGFGKEFLGEKNVEILDIRMTAEDFAYFTSEKKGFMYRLGVGNSKKGINFPLHNSKFNIDESAIDIGIGTMAFLTHKFLNI